LTNWSEPSETKRGERVIPLNRRMQRSTDVSRSSHRLTWSKQARTGLHSGAQCSRTGRELIPSSSSTPESSRTRSSSESESSETGPGGGSHPTPSSCAMLHNMERSGPIFVIQSRVVPHPVVIRIKVIVDQPSSGSGDPLSGSDGSFLHDRMTWLRMEMRSGPYQVGVRTTLAHQGTKCSKHTLTFVGSHPMHAHPVYRGSSYYNVLELEIIIIPAPGSWKKAVLITQGSCL
jgi:hypothetical protein